MNFLTAFVLLSPTIIHYFVVWYSLPIVASLALLVLNSVVGYFWPSAKKAFLLVATLLFWASAATVCWFLVAPEISAWHMTLMVYIPYAGIIVCYWLCGLFSCDVESESESE